MNPKSPRAGLLTFEHQGCPQFESAFDSDEETQDESPAAVVREPATPSPSGKHIRISLDDLEMAFARSAGDASQYYLDVETGEIVWLSDYMDDDEELSERIETDGGVRYRSIEPLDSRESFRIMEEFVSSLPECVLKSRLQGAVSGHKPFRRFKDAVHADLTVRDHWFAFRRKAIAQRARLAGERRRRGGDGLSEIGVRAHCKGGERLDSPFLHPCLPAVSTIKAILINASRRIPSRGGGALENSRAVTDRG